MVRLVNVFLTLYRFLLGSLSELLAALVIIIIILRECTPRKWLSLRCSYSHCKHLIHQGRELDKMVTSRWRTRWRQAIFKWHGPNDVIHRLRSIVVALCRLADLLLESRYFLLRLSRVSPLRASWYVRLRIRLVCWIQQSSTPLRACWHVSITLKVVWNELAFCYVRLGVLNSKEQYRYAVTGVLAC